MRRTLLFALCGMGLTGCVGVNSGSRPMGSIIGRMESTPQPGDWCRVTFPEHKSGSEISRTELTGRVEAVDEQGIHLSEVVEEGRSMQATPVLSRLPYVGRNFQHTGVGRSAVEPRTVTPDEFERLVLIGEDDAWKVDPPLVARDQTVVKQLVAAVPGRRG